MTTLKDYPYYAADSEKDIYEQLRTICNIRKDDIAVFRNLTNIFIGGRLVGKIPMNSGDVAPTDRIGDVSRDDTNTYVLQNEISPQWIKYTGSTF